MKDETRNWKFTGNKRDQKSTLKSRKYVQLLGCTSNHNHGYFPHSPLFRRYVETLNKNGYREGIMILKKKGLKF